VVPLYQSVLSGLLIGLKGEIGGSLRVYAKKDMSLIFILTIMLAIRFSRVL